MFQSVRLYRILFFHFPREWWAVYFVVTCVCVYSIHPSLSLYGLIRFVLNPWNRDLSDKQYSYVVEKQPLGRRLFEDYCREQLHYKNWIEFLEMVNQYELSISDKKQIADKIRKEFLAPDALR